MTSMTYLIFSLAWLPGMIDKLTFKGFFLLEERILAVEDHGSDYVYLGFLLTVCARAVSSG